MPKVKGRVLFSKIENGRCLVTVALDGKIPQKGEAVTLKWGRRRSNSQNALMWAFLEFLMDAGMKDEYSSADELHEMLKATFLSKRVFKNGLEFIKVGSTTDLDKIAFCEYLDKINEAMITYQGINTSSFWSEHDRPSAAPLPDVLPPDPLDSI